MEIVFFDLALLTLGSLNAANLNSASNDVTSNPGIAEYNSNDSEPSTSQKRDKIRKEKFGKKIFRDIDEEAKKLFKKVGESK